MPVLRAHAPPTSRTENPMSDFADSVARLLDFDSPGPGPVNTVLHESVRSLGGLLRAQAARGRAGKRGAPPEAPGAAGLLDDERFWHVRIEPEAVVLATAIEEMKRVFDQGVEGAAGRFR